MAYGVIAVGGTGKACVAAEALRNEASQGMGTIQDGRWARGRKDRDVKAASRY